MGHKTYWRVGSMLGTGLVIACAVLVSPGCAEKQPTTRPTSWHDQARSDPYNFNPGLKDEWPDVSGGGIGQFDKKAFNRDLNNVLNP